MLILEEISIPAKLRTLHQTTNQLKRDCVQELIITFGEGDGKFTMNTCLTMYYTLMSQMSRFVLTNSHAIIMSYVP